MSRKSDPPTKFEVVIDKTCSLKHSKSAACYWNCSAFLLKKTVRFHPLPSVVCWPFQCQRSSAADACLQYSCEWPMFVGNSANNLSMPCLVSYRNVYFYQYAISFRQHLANSMQKSKCRWNITQSLHLMALKIINIG